MWVFLLLCSPEGCRPLNTSAWQFTHVRYQPFYVRWARSLWRRVCAVFGYLIPSQYVRIPSNYSLDTGYLLLGYIEPTTGQMLSATWNTQRHDAERRRNLFRGISRLLISISRVQLPRIGSWTFHNDGSISLSNRPLTCSIPILEQAGAPRAIQPKQTYTCVEPYVSDLLALHDGRFLAQPNAANDKRDCRFQMAVQASLRTISHHYYDRDLRDGPFVMQFSDLHARNILVDADWNITGLIDLEWICSRPAEMVDVPYWITGLGIDEVGDEENIADYVRTREEFMGILEDEERKSGLRPEQNMCLSRIMRRSWESKSCWFTHCLDSVNAMYALFDQHLRPQFVDFDLTEKMEVLISRFWRQHSDELVAKKLEEKEQYLEELQKLFGRDIKLLELEGSVEEAAIRELVIEPAEPAVPSWGRRRYRAAHLPTTLLPSHLFNTSTRNGTS